MKIWIELENITNLDGTKPDIQNEVSNVVITLDNGDIIGLNVWSYKFLQSLIDRDSQTGENQNGIYQIPPDLLVKEISRDCIEKSVIELIEKGLLADLAK